MKLFWAASGAGYHMAGGFARLATLLDRIGQGKDGQVLAFNGGNTVLWHLRYGRCMHTSQRVLGSYSPARALNRIDKTLKSRPVALV
jgi:hypothetical protein